MRIASMNRAFKVKPQIHGQAIIRKVFKGKHFTCGICRGHFDHYNDAYDCVESCWESALHSYPLTVYKKASQQNVYRCRFCMREHASEEAGIHCADMCKHLAEETNAFGLRVLKDLQNAPVRGNASQRRPQLVAMRSQGIPRYKMRSNMEEDTATPQTVEDTSSGATAEVMTPATGDDVAHGKVAKGKGDTSADTRRSKAQWKKPFIRNGAKYVCSYCNGEFFTKSEVETCFDGHFDQNDKEVAQP